MEKKIIFTPRFVFSSKIELRWTAVHALWEPGDTLKIPENYLSLYESVIPANLPCDSFHETQMMQEPKKGLVVMLTNGPRGEIGKHTWTCLREHTCKRPALCSSDLITAHYSSERRSAQNHWAMRNRQPDSWISLSIFFLEHIGIDNLQGKTKQNKKLGENPQTCVYVK